MAVRRSREGHPNMPEPLRRNASGQSLRVLGVLADPAAHPADGDHQLVVRWPVE